MYVCDFNLLCTWALVVEMMEHIFLFLSCVDLVACSASCGRWLGILKTGFLWRQYCVGLGLPMPLTCYATLRYYVACLLMMEKCWLRYKVYVDRRRDEPWKRPLCDVTGVCDLSRLGDPLRLGRHCIAPVLRDALRTLFKRFGALPYDYVAALDTVWQPDVDFALGDLLLVLGGVPIMRDMCRIPFTEICAVTIGYVCPNGFGGHRSGEDFDVHELVMSFRVGSRGQVVDVCYIGMCHNQIGMQHPGIFGLPSAAAAVAAFPVSLDEMVLTPFLHTGLRVHTFRSFADVVTVCTRSIEQPGTRPDFFLPCFLYWVGVQNDCEHAAEDNVSFGISVLEETLVMSPRTLTSTNGL